MKHTKSIVASVLLISAVAASSVFASSSSVIGMTNKMNKGNPFSNTGVIQLLKDKGITAPTPDEAKAFEIKMMTMQKAEKSLSTAAKAELELLRKSFRKQEREFYRTQGVVLPSEDEITKMEMIRDLLKPATGSGAQDKGRGMRDDTETKGPGMGRGMEDSETMGQGMSQGMEDREGMSQGTGRGKMKRNSEYGQGVENTTVQRETRGTKNGQQKKPRGTPETQGTPPATN